MVEESTNNSTVDESASVQEPTNEGLEATEEITEETGTDEVQPDAEAKDTESTVKETKTKGVDLNKAIAKLSPEEQKAYKKFQAEFTKKSQTLSEVERARAEYEDYVNKLNSDPEISALFKARAERTAKSQEPDFSKMSDEEIFNYTVDKRVADKLSELENKMESKYGSYINSRLVSEGDKLISDFATAKKIDVDEARELGKYAVDHRMSLDDAYKVAYFDRIPAQAKQEALQELNLKKSANLENGNIPTGVNPITPERPTIAEAFAAAKRELKM